MSQNTENNIKSFSIQIKNHNNLILPKKGESMAAGYDLTAISDPEIVGEELFPGIYRRIDYIQYRTGVYLNQTEKLDCSFDEADGSITKIELVNYLYSYMFPRSSITKYNLILKNSVGVIDTQYQSEILVRFSYVQNPEDFVFLDPEKHPSFGVKVNFDKIYKKFDRIAQLVFAEPINVNFEVVEDFDQKSNRGGFGSTGF